MPLRQDATRSFLPTQEVAHKIEMEDFDIQRDYSHDSIERLIRCIQDHSTQAMPS
jgi:hypothetical protein